MNIGEEIKTRQGLNRLFWAYFLALVNEAAYLAISSLVIWPAVMLGGLWVMVQSDPGSASLSLGSITIGEFFKSPFFGLTGMSSLTLSFLFVFSVRIPKHVSALLSRRQTT